MCCQSSRSQTKLVYVVPSFPNNFIRAQDQCGCGNCQFSQNPPVEHTSTSFASSSCSVIASRFLGSLWKSVNVPSNGEHRASPSRSTSHIYKSQSPDPMQCYLVKPISIFILEEQTVLLNMRHFFKVLHLNQHDNLLWLEKVRIFYCLLLGKKNSCSYLVSGSATWGISPAPENCQVDSMEVQIPYKTHCIVKETAGYVSPLLNRSVLSLLWKDITKNQDINPLQCPFHAWSVALTAKRVSISVSCSSGFALQTFFRRELGCKPVLSFHTANQSSHHAVITLGHC